MHLVKHGSEQLAPGIKRVELAHQPADLAHAAVMRYDVVACAETMQQRRRDKILASNGDQAQPLGHPGINEVLGRLALELAKYGIDRQHHAWDDRSDVKIDQRRQLITITAL